MTTNKLFQSSTDTFSAPNVNEATRMRDELYEWEPGGQESMDNPFDPNPLPDDRIYALTLQQFDDLPATMRVDPDPDIKIEPADRSVSKTAAMYGGALLTVRAPARVWAKHFKGMVGSTEW